MTKGVANQSWLNTWPSGQTYVRLKPTSGAAVMSVGPKPMKLTSAWPTNFTDFTRSVLNKCINELYSGSSLTLSIHPSASHFTLCLKVSSCDWSFWIKLCTWWQMAHQSRCLCPLLALLVSPEFHSQKLPISEPPHSLYPPWHGKLHRFLL